MIAGCPISILGVLNYRRAEVHRTYARKSLFIICQSIALFTPQIFQVCLHN